MCPAEVHTQRGNERGCTPGQEIKAYGSPSPVQEDTFLCGEGGPFRRDHLAGRIYKHNRIESPKCEEESIHLPVAETAA